MSQDAKTKANTLKKHNERRMYRRQNDSKFAEKERLASKQYRDYNREFGRLASEFIRAYCPQEFELYVQRGVVQQTAREACRQPTSMELALANLKSQGLDIR
jgi:hypothetical protein